MLGNISGLWGYSRRGKEVATIPSKGIGLPHPRPSTPSWPLCRETTKNSPKDPEEEEWEELGGRSRREGDEPLVYEPCWMEEQEVIPNPDKKKEIKRENILPLGCKATSPIRIFSKSSTSPNEYVRTPLVEEGGDEHTLG